MISKGIILISFLMFLSGGCRQTAGPDTLIMRIENAMKEGNINIVQKTTDSLKLTYPDETHLIKIADSLSQIAERILIDFPVAGADIDSQIRKWTGDYSKEERELWERRNWLEARMINGERKYFTRAASNLNLLRSFHENRDLRDSSEAMDREIVHRKNHTESIINASVPGGQPVIPVNMIIKYTLTVEPDAVPHGEKVKCWLPYPREDHPRQQKISFISASHNNYIIAPDTAVHRTIYMEAFSEKGMPLSFGVSFAYQSSGQYFNPDEIKSLPYVTDSRLYKEFTADQPPHINFNGKLKSLADSITAGSEYPVQIVKDIYYWFSENIPWTGALEYSIISDIPGYVLQNRRGDCGMQTFLFMSMLRYKGIPVRWQSGWKVPPEGKNLHDWCEVYYEGTGWVPVDISYGLQYSDNRKTRDFYISGIDSYRLIINNGVSGALYPEKKFLRSEPYDFQRGEVEWSGGNLYFDKWDYEMQIEYPF